jgi:hypothetical protein
MDRGSRASQAAALKVEVCSFLAFLCFIVSAVFGLNYTLKPIHFPLIQASTRRIVTGFEFLEGFRMAAIIMA